MSQALPSSFPSPGRDAEESPAPGARRPDVPAVRGQLPPAVLRRSRLAGVTFVVGAAGLYAALVAGAVLAPYWPAQLACGIAAGFLIGTLFTVAHDACHGSFTGSDRLNRLLGRLCFLPSLTPFTSWEYAHNRIHHSYTNLRGRDYAWAPFSKAEFDRLPRLRQWLERHYRSWFGMGTYYLVEYWWKHLLFPPAAERAEMGHRRAFVLDRLLVAGFLLAQVAALWAWVASAEPADREAALTSFAGLVVAAVVVPFLVWNWLMGFIIFQHHNHPRVAWYASREEWDFFAAQVESTTHVQLPWAFEWVSGSIMQHTAHHVNPKVPLYHLTAAQHALEQAYPATIVAERWTMLSLARTLARCKLYDYENHRWLNFRGRGTTEPHPVVRAMREARASEVSSLCSAPKGRNALAPGEAQRSPGE